MAISGWSWNRRNKGQIPVFNAQARVSGLPLLA
jgi:hypothetical protein